MKFVAHVTSYLQCLQHVAKRSNRSMFWNNVPAILLQNLPLARALATRETFWFYHLCNMKKNYCGANASRNIARVAAA